MKKIVRFFDRLEDKVRARLSHYPIIYSMVAGFAIVIFWRSVWHLADEFQLASFPSLIISVVVLLMTGVFTSFFVGDAILMSGIKREKKLIEKTEEELTIEAGVLKRLQSEVSREESLLSEIRSELIDLRKMVDKLNTVEKK